MMTERDRRMYQHAAWLLRRTWNANADEAGAASLRHRRWLTRRAIRNEMAVNIAERVSSGRSVDDLSLDVYRLARKQLLRIDARDDQ